MSTRIHARIKHIYSSDMPIFWVNKINESDLYVYRIEFFNLVYYSLGTHIQKTQRPVTIFPNK